MHRTLTDTLLDVVQNSIEAESGLIILDVKQTDNLLDVFISDNGRGMNEEQLKSALDPFYTDGEKHSGRTVGLGLPFLKQTCEATGGRFEIGSKEGEGTSVFIELNMRHIDLPPLGDLAELFTDAMLFEGGFELVVNRYYGGVKYTVIRSELAEVLGDMNDVASIVLMQRYFDSQEKELLAEALGRHE